MKITKCITGEPVATQSTLLVGKAIAERLKANGIIRGKDLAFLLHRLLYCKDLRLIVAGVRPHKWKKQYQREGQDLQRLNFYPNQSDWARLSALSNATGFSRCYIFIILVLHYLDKLETKKNGTQKTLDFIAMDNKTKCEILLDSDKKFLERALL